MSYAEKIAKKYRIPYMEVERIYLGNGFSVYLESNGPDKWRLVTPKSVIRVKDDGGIYISGNVTIDSPLSVNGNLICNEVVTAKQFISGSL